ncbi:PREDICTED: adrenocortical dysplasia protein-like, partial [Tauraco erythrolophus]|uniref:adrenocortical dysplasia protein-like n=1 Tax=Tauraco erythrolophus TaxID=121530 RepID=UPI000523991F
FVCENKAMSSPKVYVLQPWIVNLLVNYEQLDASENLLAGQVLRVLSDSAAPGQPEVLQDAVLQVSDGSYHVRVVITAEALHAEENTHMQLRLSSLICRIIVLQKYTVCFREEARLEDCEFYLTAQRFIVLPMERQRLESSDGRSLALKNAPSSEPSISQLIDAIGQNQLEVLKENAEECLDLQVPEEAPATVKDEVPVTQWEAERKKERGEDVFVVPANALVIPPEEEAIACNAFKAAVELTALSESSEGSLDNPWNRLPPLSLTLNSSDEKTFERDLSLKTQEDVAAEEPCSQDSAKGLQQEEPVQTSSPSLLSTYGRTSPVETSTTQAFPHLPGGDGMLKAGVNVDGGPDPPERGSRVLGEGVIEPELGGNQHLLERLPALRYVREKPAQYRYEAPSPELCQQIRSVRISKAMLKWACWIVADREMDS